MTARWFKVCFKFRHKNPFVKMKEISWFGLKITTLTVVVKATVVSVVKVYERTGSWMNVDILQ